MFEKILLENTQIFIDEKISMVCFKNLVGWEGAGNIDNKILRNTS